MKLFYRISDKSFNKSKLIGSTKEVCLMNFCKAFAEVIFSDLSEEYVPPIMVLADNCERKTIKMIQEAGLPVTVTSEGNAGSLRKAIEIALEYDDDELVYFCEDDYLHLGSAPKIIEEGIKRADYVTLYDHPDKYTRNYNGGEFSKVIKTASSHWRYTVSTCMTFGTKVGKLREDKDIWFDDEMTGEFVPHDHHIFGKLNEKGRRLAVAIPGVACHVDLTFSGTVNAMLMEHWAIDMMIGELTAELEEYWDKRRPLDALSPSGHEEFQKYIDYCRLRDSMIKDKVSQEKLLALDALRQQIKKA